VSDLIQANKVYWLGKCKLIPLNASYIKISMGLNTDYFKPKDGATFCEMLVSNSKHQWSEDGAHWFTPVPYTASHTGSIYGGSDTGWPKTNLPGDIRSYLSFWGMEGGMGGCCHSVLKDVEDKADWSQHFKLEWCHISKEQQDQLMEVGNDGDVKAETAKARDAW